MDYEAIISDIIEGYRRSPVDLLGLGDGEGEHHYLLDSKEAYIRTLRDIDALFDTGREGRHLLEIGPFLGATTLGLRRMGYAVSAMDIPEYHNSPTLRALFEKNEIPFAGVNLRSAVFPYPDHAFDAVIICEVIEHLNFNPLPMLKEINRILKPGGYLYIGMPNQASLGKRKRLLTGGSINPPIDQFYQQLDRHSNMIVGLHWREYTLEETTQLISGLGFELANGYHYFPNHLYSKNPLKAALERLIYAYPPFRPYLVAIGKKVADTDIEFWQSESST